MFSCAYFNTFYNTKKYFNEALQETAKRTTDRPGTTERQKFDKTISQASKVLQLYPESKYVDDALLILGKSFFYIEDYRKAERKFVELIEIYPNSEKLEEAKLWLAKTQINLEHYDLAVPDLQILQKASGSKAIRSEAQFWLGEAFFQRKLYLEAAKEFTGVLDQIGDNEMQARTYRKLGESYLELGSYFRAAEAFENAAKYSQNLERQFDLSLQHAKALNAAANHDEAIDMLDALVSKNDQHKNIGLAKLELAHSYLAKNADEKAIEIYNDIIELHPRTTAAAGAFLALARYDEEVLNNYETAEENYRQAALQDNRSEYAKIANAKAVNINNLRKLQQGIAELRQKIRASQENADAQNAQQTKALSEGQLDDSIADVRPQAKKGTSARREQLLKEDSVTRKDEPEKQSELNSLEGLAQAGNPASRPPESNRPSRENTPAKEQPTIQLTQAQIDSIELLITGKKIQLAESFYFDFLQPDSALFYYLDAISGSNSKEYRALAFYSITKIYEDQAQHSAVRDSVLKILAYNYQDTEQGISARVQLGLAEAAARKHDPATAAFIAAEELYLKQNKPRAAMDRLQNVLEIADHDELKMKAMYTLGWISEHQLQESEQALSYYRQLVEIYPTSEFAKRVTPKIRAVEQAKQEAEAAKQPASTEPRTPTTSDSTAAKGTAAPTAESTPVPAPPAAKADSTKAAKPKAREQE